MEELLDLAHKAGDVIREAEERENPRMVSVEDVRALISQLKRPSYNSFDLCTTCATPREDRCDCNDYNKGVEDAIEVFAEKNTA